ncbi:MAG: nucleotidyltransferase domain-containing protein [Candidatus Aenigmarchaeota archaeon]|nr:nucleotidyltransferase domain-containing protein [Candidatus Aenigmarchaeota archaeon]
MGKKKPRLMASLRKFRQDAEEGFPIERMIVFGSTASGKAGKDSDIDLLIVSPRFRQLNFFQRGARMYDFWNLPYPVDFLCYTPEEFNRLKRQRTIVREAVEHGIEIS